MVVKPKLPRAVPPAMDIVLFCWTVRKAAQRLHSIMVDEVIGKVKNLEIWITGLLQGLQSTVSYVVEDK